VVAQDGSKCIILSATPTFLKCKPEAFIFTTIAATVDRIFTVTVNTVPNNSQKATLLATFQKGTGVTPNNVSPVLVNDLVVQLESTYSGAMTSRADFIARLVDQNNSTNVRSLYVMSIDATAKTLKLKFTGAMSGTYKVELEAKDIGRIDSSANTIIVGSTVDSIAPLEGSYLGGTLLTITGSNFSKEKLDNPVKVGNYWCFVETSSETQITCRVSSTTETTASQANVLVFLRTQEEAKLKKVGDVAIPNIFSLNAPKASVTALTGAFDATTNTEVLTLTGTGFGTDTTKIELLIDGTKQTCLTATDTQATFTLSHLDHESTNGVKIFFADGLPSGYDKIKSVAITPKLVSISPSTGSAGGTLITVKGTGFGKKTTGVTLVSGTVDICQTVEIKSYGTFTCLTKAMEIPTSAVL